MTTDVCTAFETSSDKKNSIDLSTGKFSRLLLNIVISSILVFLGVVGLITYFWGLPVSFQPNDLSVFFLCFLIAQLLWHYFSLFSLQSEGVVRNQQSVWMFCSPNRLLITSLTLALSVIVFYWNFLFLPELEYFITAVFFSILFPQFFVRIWELFLQRDSSYLPGFVALGILMLLVVEEVRYGIGFRFFATQVEKVAQLESKPGQSKKWEIPVPDSPRWKRDGLLYYPQLFSVLHDAGYKIDKNTHLALSPQAKKLVEMGIIPFNHYQGSAFSGLRILDNNKNPIYQYEHPNQYRNFEHISPFILKALLVWENDKLRHLVFPVNTKGENNINETNTGIELNYLIEGPRIVKSLAEYLQYKITGEGAFSGGSTLMTTLEKITNTPGGRTQTVKDKIRQMFGAGMHLYAGSSNAGVKNALVDFLNTVPMAGGPKKYTGELYGFGASYFAWYGYSIDELNEQLQSKDSAIRAQAYKNICALIVSIRRPSGLLKNPEKIELQANLLLEQLNRKQLLNSALFLKARSLAVAWEPQAKNREKPDYAVHREAFSVRNQYAHMVRQAVEKKIGKEASHINLQTVDTMPAMIELTTDSQLELGIRQVLSEMYSEVAQKSPFVQKNQKGLLNDLTREESEQIKYGVLILEINKDKQWNILANTDTQMNKVYNPAKQGRFQWGSTAKLRVLVNYLMIMHNEADVLKEALKKGNTERLAQYQGSSVTIKRLLAAYIKQNPDSGKNDVLNWAMSRRLSASPKSKFLTGESWHQFHNYQKSDDKKNPNLWQMTTESINLSFVRLMRDIVDYYIEQLGYDKVAILKDINNPIRKRIINEAVKKNEAVYLEGMNFFIDQIQKQLIASLSSPAIQVQEVEAISRAITDKEIIAAARKMAKDIKNSSDKVQEKYRALALLFKRITYNEKNWLLDRVKRSGLLNFASAGSLSPTIVDKHEKRILQQTSKWLRRHKPWITNTLYTYMERQAFAKGVTPAWKKLGYPFNVSPSYAVVLGSSGDTPMSLLELVGTLLNDGVHEKNITAIKRIVLAPDSQFETPFKRESQSEAVIPEEVARITQKAMEGVLHKGTAIFVSRHPLMQFVHSAGAKTGTGDNRYNERPINRSAAVLSLLDTGNEKSKYAVCITMSVTKGDIRRYNFTSKIPVRILSRIADQLSPIVTKKTTKEIQIELAAQRARQSKMHNLAIISASTRKNRIPYESRHKKKASSLDDASSQLYENLF